MAKIYFLFLIILSLLAFVNDSFSEVRAPQDHFRLEQLDSFFPGKSFSDIPDQWGKPKLMGRKGGVSLFRFEISHRYYRFPLLVQVYDNKVVDFFASLPSYFLHDVFHQSLINRYGKQKTYIRKEKQAYYKWNTKKGLSHSYAGACSITCFPLYYSVYPQAPPRVLSSIRRSLKPCLSLTTLGNCSPPPSG